MRKPLRDWENPQITNRNRMPSRAYYNPYSSDKELGKGENTNIMNLDGTWDFMFLEAPEYAPEGFFLPDFASENFDAIDVPSCWQMKGYGKMHYADLLYPFHVDPPYVPVDNPTGIYKRKFTLTSKWCDNRTVLRLHGVDSAYHVWVNGKEVGFSKVSRMLSEFDLTKYVHEGENDITLCVYQWSDASYIEDQDMWWLSGIFRSVELLNEPLICFHDIFVKTDFHNDALTDSTLTVEVDIKHYIDDYKQVNGQVNHRTYELNGQLWDENNQLLTSLNETDRQLAIEEVEDTHKILLKATVQNPMLWSAETPYLYTLKLCLKSNTGEQHVSLHIGFRKIVVKGSNFFVNGKAIMLNGVNRHDFNCEHGRTVSKEDMEKDVILMKQHNINAVRTSHYPNMSYFYELCDKYGLYVIDEADLECHGFEPVGFYDWTSNSCHWTEAYVDRALRMVRRDKNHACIIMWSLGNESSFGSNFYEMVKAIKALDNSRLIHYESDYKSSISDVYSTMYTRLERLKEIGAKEGHKPHIICEYGHAMGNGPGGLLEHQQVFRQYKRLQGGFIWEWIDHGIKREDEKGNIYYSYGGDYGDFPHNSNFCMDGLVFPDRTPSPALIEYKKVIEPVKTELKDLKKGIITVTNLYDFLDLSHLDFSWKITANGKEIKSGTCEDHYGIMPLESKDINLPIHLDVIEMNRDYRLWIEFTNKGDKLWAKKGHVLATGDIQLPFNNSEWSIRETKQPLVIKEDNIKVYLSGEDFEVVFDRLHGCLERYSYKGHNLIEKGIGLNFWRAPIDNDMYVVDDFKNKYFLHMFYGRPYDFSYEMKDNSLVITINEINGPVSQAFGYDVFYRYEIFFNGHIKLHVQGKCINEKLNPPEMLPKIGLEMCIPGKDNRVEWYGRGPGESYPDSKTGCSISYYELPVHKMHTPYPYPQENGNRSDVSWLSIKGQMGLFIRSDELFHFTAHDYTKEALENAKHQNELKKVSHTLLNLDYKQNGLGSASCGQDQLPAYKVKFEDFQFSFELRPFDPKEKKASELATIKYK